MSNKKSHISHSVWGSDWVHDGNCNVIGWVDNNGDVHPKGDVGTCFSGPETIIGHVDDDGLVKITGEE